MCVDFTLDHDQPQRPLTSPRSIASTHIVAAGIAVDDLEIGAEHAVEDARELVGIGARAGAADRELLGEEVVELGDAGTLHRHADADFVVGAADPGEFRGVERVALADQQRIEGGCRGRSCRTRCRPWGRRDRANWRAAGCRRLPCSSARWSGCRECDCRDGGPMHAGVEIVSAADAIADIQLDVPALVEIGRCYAPCAMATRAATATSTAATMQQAAANVEFNPASCYASLLRSSLWPCRVLPVYLLRYRRLGHYRAASASLAWPLTLRQNS